MTIITDFDRYMNSLIDLAQQPYALHTPAPAPTDAFAKYWYTTFNRLPCKETNIATQNALLLATLALQAYHAEHNAYPDSLATLVPTYLHAVPGDPFALNQPLRYHQTAQGYLLYSIGPDGKDDGGTPSSDGQLTSPPDPEEPSRAKGIQGASTGDIVAGINVL